MGKKTHSGNRVSGDPRKRAAAKRENQKKEGLDHVIDDFMDTEVAEKSDSMAEAFLSSRSQPATSKETVSIKRFFLVVAIAANALRISDREASINFEKMAGYTGLSNELRTEIQCWMQEKGMVVVN